MQLLRLVLFLVHTMTTDRRFSLTNTLTYENVQDAGAEGIGHIVFIVRITVSNVFRLVSLTLI